MPRASQQPDASLGRMPLPATSRHHILIEWLRAGRVLTTRLAADTLDVSRRTVARDLVYLRDARGLAIAYDSTQGTYTLDQRQASIPFVPHPDLWAVILRGEFAAPDMPASDDGIRIRYSQRSVQAYAVSSGIDLTDALDAEGRLEVWYDGTTNRDEFVRWVLSSGAEAEVLAPPDLRRRVAVEIQRMRAIYHREGSQTA